MCGIVSIFNIQEQTPELRQQALRMSQKIRHRGPDWSGIYCGGSAILAHERLSIVDPESGRQPLFAPDKKQVLAVNGEIYNHQDIRARFAGKYQYQTGSDCEVILSLYPCVSLFSRVVFYSNSNIFFLIRVPLSVMIYYVYNSCIWMNQHD